MNRALLEIMGLKALTRAGWERHGIAHPESVAGHSWGVACLTLLLLPDGLDLERALTYAVIHDLAEVRTGDITPYDRVSTEDKAAAERNAMADLAAGLPRGAALLDAWQRYEAQADPEATFVRQVDRLDMALQAVSYTEAGHSGLREFLDSAAQVIADPELRRLLAALQQHHASLD